MIETSNKSIEKKLGAWYNVHCRNSFLIFFFSFILSITSLLLGQAIGDQSSTTISMWFAIAFVLLAILFLLIDTQVQDIFAPHFIFPPIYFLILGLGTYFASLGLIHVVTGDNPPILLYQWNSYMWGITAFLFGVWVVSLGRLKDITKRRTTIFLDMQVPHFQNQRKKTKISRW